MPIDFLKILAIACLVCLAVTDVAVSADKPADSGTKSSETLETLVQQWTDLRLQTAEEEQAWRENRHLLVNELALVRTENEQLLALIEESGVTESSLLEDRAYLLERKEELKKAVDKIGKHVTDFEDRLGKWYSRIPVSLRSEIEPLFKQVTAQPNVRQNRSLPARVQTVLSLYSKIEEIQGKTHVTVEMIETPEGRVEMKVLYLGLAKGFAVTGDNKRAYEGYPSADKGWTWLSNPELAQNINRAISVHERQVPPELVELPLNLPKQ